MEQTLQELIASKNLGVKDAARRAHVGRTSLWRWCNGLSAPRYAQAAALARVLRVKVDDVLAAAEASTRLATAC